MVRILYTNNKGYLAADRPLNPRSKNNDSEVFIRKYLGEYKEEIFSVNSIWQIEQLKNDELGS